MHDSNGHVSATEMVAEISDQRLLLSCRTRTAGPAMPGMPDRPSQRRHQAARVAPVLSRAASSYLPDRRVIHHAAPAATASERIVS